VTRPEPRLIDRGAHPPPQEARHDRQEERDHRQAEREPLDERDLPPRELIQELDRERVRRRPDRAADAADRGRVRDP
jgi:hypothetical protein